MWFKVAIVMLTASLFGLAVIGLIAFYCVLQLLG
jgi:hypothetical protein